MERSHVETKCDIVCQEFLQLCHGPQRMDRILEVNERNHYALARILVSPANFLLLDEPTNHLDLRAKEVLLEAIRNFSGTVIFFSHDRYFLDALGTRVFEVAEGTVHIYPGNYEDYLRRKAGLADPVAAAAAAVAVSVPSVEPAETNGRPARRVNPIKQKQMRDRLTFVEEQIPRVESSIAETEKALGEYVSVEETQRQNAALETLRAEHASLSAEWEDLMQQLEEQASV